MKILVTGGAGYIGSHAARALLDAGHEVVVIDDLSKGHRAALDPRARFVQGAISDARAVGEAVKGCDAVMHFAAKSIVPESCEKPLEYWQNNVGGSLVLLDAMRKAGVDRLVFSSTAATYGIPDRVPIPEDSPTVPINPYGQSKLATEQAILDLASSDGRFSCAILRYFNVAGCAWGLGEDHSPETHVVPILLQTALGRRDRFTIYGTDYATPDGTCIRDYVHVRDLVDAHLVVLQALQPGERRIYNIGTGHGFSVLEMVDTAKRITGRDFTVVEGDRRRGDPPALVTDPTRIQQELAWRPKYSSLGQIFRDHWEWVQAHPEGWAERAEAPEPV